MGRALQERAEHIVPAVMNQREAATYCGVGTSLLAELTARHAVPSIRLAGRRLYRREALDSWLASLETVRAPA